MHGATIVLDSSGGSVNDSIALGRRFRDLDMLTTVGTSVLAHDARGDHGNVVPEAYCESMCVFLLLSGKARYVPEAAHVRVHQIWMGDRADDAKGCELQRAGSDDRRARCRPACQIHLRHGRRGDLLALALSVPPWEELHELTPAELRQTNLVTTDKVADVLPQADVTVPMAQLTPRDLGPKSVQDRFVSNAGESDASAVKPTKTAEVVVPTVNTAPAK